MSNQYLVSGKKRSESSSVMTELVLPNDANQIGNLLGGRLLHYIDIAGALAAMRHSGGLVATKIIDPVTFRSPIKVGEIVELTSYVTWTGTTSIETAVEVYAESTLTGGRRFISKAYLVFVAIDLDGVKRAVPALIPGNDAERADCAAGELRQRARLG